MSEPKRILIRGVNWLGDAVMTTPALQRIRERFPSAHITLASPAKLAGLWDGYPHIDHCLVLKPEGGLTGAVKSIRSDKADLGVVFPNSARTALELFFSGIPQRWGYGNGWRKFLLNRKIDPPAARFKMQKKSAEDVRRLVAENRPVIVPPASAHQIFHYLHIAGSLGADAGVVEPKIHVSEDEKRRFLQAYPELGRHRNGAGRILGINAGAEYGPAKRWPRENFLRAAVDVSKQTSLMLMIFGGSNDVELAAWLEHEIRRANPAVGVVNLAGKTSLRTLCVSLSLCTVLLTNDTGPMHVAAAVGTCLVVPFGSTSPELTGPGMPGDPRHVLIKSTVPCSPCFLRECPIDFRCMLSISPGTVVAKVIDSLTVD